MFQYVLHKYLNNRYIQINSLLLRYNKSHDAEVVHGLRLEIKKLHALSQLVYFTVSKKEDRRVRVCLRPIYKHLGKLRDSMQFEAISKEYHLKIDIRYDFNRQVLEFPALYKKNLRKSKQILKQGISSISYLEFQNFLVQFFGEIRNISNTESLKPVKIHELRKRIKYFLFLLKILEKFPEDYAILDFPTEQYAIIQEKIGKWHDKYRFIKTFGSKCREDLFFQELKTSATCDLKSIRLCLKNGI